MISWSTLKSDWKRILKNPQTIDNTDAVVDAMVDALKTQIDNARLTGTDSRGDTHTNVRIQ